MNKTPVSAGIQVSLLMHKFHGCCKALCWQELISGVSKASQRLRDDVPLLMKSFCMVSQALGIKWRLWGGCRDKNITCQLLCSELQLQCFLLCNLSSTLL